MKASKQDKLVAQLFFSAAFPVMKVVIEENPKIKKKWENVEAVVQFRGMDDDGDLVCHLIFDKGNLTVVQGEYDQKPDLELTFNTIAKMVRMFKGSMTSLPDMKCIFKGLFTKPALLINTIMLLMQLMLMMPTVEPTDDLKKYLKVKLSLYMITTALSVANKLGWEGIKDWTMQPDRIYQFIVGDLKEPKIACYLRVKGGKSKAGRGVYQRKNPFVCFHFFSIDGAISTLLRKKEFVESVEAGDVEIIGAPEYGAQLNDIMSILQDLLVTL
ncbi:MAG: hypothetical protein QM214_00620 [Bacillota bacterium]|jgi:hypothetical protein|nr:hypothetical protein [Bacillota bacterium]HHU43560.1 hypothetical protein [Clostridiales bacterium]